MILVPSPTLEDLRYVASPLDVTALGTPAEMAVEDELLLTRPDVAAAFLALSPLVLLRVTTAVPAEELLVGAPLAAPDTACLEAPIPEPVSLLATVDPVVLPATP